MFPFITNQHRLEMTWTVVPAVILLYIAFAQVPVWLRIKDRSRTPTFGGKQVPIQVEVSARQFEWRVRYPSSARMQAWEKNPQLAQDFGSSPHEDDLHMVNEIHVWKGTPDKDAK